MSRLIPDDLKNKGTFNKVAVLYNKARPTYPDALFERLIDVTALPPNAKLIEIGPGTGQATKPLADRGYEITAIELGKDLADVAREVLKNYENVTVIIGSFEDTNLPEHSFDLVFAATAFHWIKPELRYAKPHKLLKPNGHLAIIHTNYISDEQGDVFFKASQIVYDKYYTNDGKDKPILPTPADVQPTELDEKLFKLTNFSTFPMVVEYTANDYADLINTYSPTLALPENKSREFLADIKELINKDFNSKVSKHFVMSLTVAEPINP